MLINIAQNTLAVVLTNNLNDLNKYVDDLRQTLLKDKEILEKAFAKYELTPPDLPPACSSNLPHTAQT